MIDMEIKPYERMVYYYETDRMGIVHHSNYIRWFEEARLDWMKQTTILLFRYCQYQRNIRPCPDMEITL